MVSAQVFLPFQKFGTDISSRRMNRKTMKKRPDPIMIRPGLFSVYLFVACITFVMLTTSAKYRAAVAPPSS